MNGFMRVLALALVVMAPACSKGGQPVAEKAVGFAQQSGLVRSDRATPAAVAAPSAGSDPREAPPAPGQPGAVVPRMLTRAGRATIRVDKVETGLRAVRAIAQRLGGYVAGESVQAGEDEVRQGSLQLRVPSTRFDEAVAALNSVGKVESLEVNSEDVGQEFVDVNARLANSRRLEQRLLALLETRTGKLEDVLAVERELARVREEIERTTARVQYLQHQVDVSTLQVTVHERGPLTGTPGSNPLLEALRQSWRNFVSFVAACIALLGVVVPLAALIALVWWAAGKTKRRRSTNPPSNP